MQPFENGHGHKVLIANRGEIAIRICRTVAELGWSSLAVGPHDDPSAQHMKKADEAAFLPIQGVSAYLDIESMVDIAKAHGCTMVHPGYGFLSENSNFAKRCAEERLIFVGPSEETLKLTGDKVNMRKVAEDCGINFAIGSEVLESADDAVDFMRTVGGPILVKAVNGGGGRGIREVREERELEKAYKRCKSEAKASFGDDRVFAEELIENARHVEVQIVGDGSGDVAVIGERECSLQRSQQKIVEFSRALFLTETMRAKLYDDARGIGRALQYLGLGTIEFLVSADGVTQKNYFLELNPRLQVEHTVTEEVTGIDLVSLQLRIAAGALLKEETLQDPLSPNGLAIQLRINTEDMQLDGRAKPTSGCIEVFDLPSGPGVRIDTVGHVGYCNSLDYDALLAKLIIHTPSDDYQALLRKAYRALCEANIQGVTTNLEFLRNLLCHSKVLSDNFDVGFVDQEVQEILSAKRGHRSFSFQGIEKVSTKTKRSIPNGPEGSKPVFAPSAGRIIELCVSTGDTVEPGQIVAITEAMKMEFAVTVEVGGKVADLPLAVGSVVDEATPIMHLWSDGRELDQAEKISSISLDHMRDDLQRIFDAHDRLEDAARPDAVARRRKTGQRTARENISDLADEGSFLEYGGLALAAQRGRRSFDELQKMSPADGLITGTGTINASEFGHEKTRCAILAYDYTVFAGTQGVMAHLKKNRIFRLVEKYSLPVVMFAEGGGGRPGDTDDHGFPKLYNPTFWQLAKLSSQVPVIAIVSGRCFAGNAALVGCADVIIATRNASIGMGGPAMIEGGGLGQVEADDIGPVSMQSPNGVVDIVVDNEVDAVAVAKAVLTYTQGVISKWECEDQRYLRHVIPEEPRRAYEMRDVIRLLADNGSVVELQPEFGVGLITAFVRIEGIPFAVIANNPHHLGGAIDAAASTKAANFSATVEKFGLPLIKLCDTPGFMVGPDAEQEGLVREAGRMFSSGAKLTVPQFTIVVRKAYGLGALAMVSGNIYEQVFTVSWPTGHFGKMGLEGQIRLAYRKEIDALPDEAARASYLREKVNELYEGGNPVNAASLLSLDDVIDPLKTRDWIIGGFHAAIGDGRFDARHRPTP